MTNQEAAYILDPETTRKALAPYALDCQARMAVVNEACAVAAKALRETGWISVKDKMPPPASASWCAGKHDLERLLNPESLDSTDSSQCQLGGPRTSHTGCPCRRLRRGEYGENHNPWIPLS